MKKNVVLPSHSLYAVRFKAQLLFCLLAVLRSLCKLEEVDGRRRSMENEHLTSLTSVGQWTEPGVLRHPVQAALLLQAFLYMLLPS